MRRCRAVWGASRDDEIASTEVSVPAERSLGMPHPDLLVHVLATGPLRKRIVGTLEAGAIAMLNGDPSLAPDIRVLAIDLAQPISLRRLRQTLSQGDEGRVIAVSPACGPLGARRALRAGANSLVLEDELENALVPAVRAVAAGFSVVPAVLRDGVDALNFSHREREVLRLAIAGHTNGAIATSLFLAESTVKSHLSSAYRKLGAGGRKEAASMILDPDEGLVEMILGRGAHDGHIGRDLLIAREA
jgi:DNA-binding NarL/FixJ family response regulator